eukprot:SAG31_NODE_598_length_13651_cov_10.681818_6_plen_165_part_00
MGSLDDSCERQAEPGDTRKQDDETVLLEQARTTWACRMCAYSNSCHNTRCDMCEYRPRTSMSAERATASEQDCAVGPNIEDEFAEQNVDARLVRSIADGDQPIAIDRPGAVQKPQDSGVQSAAEQAATDSDTRVSQCRCWLLVNLAMSNSLFIIALSSIVRRRR